jgi:trans-aconitate 2-methyltransferase
MTEWNADDYAQQSSLQLAMANEQLRMLTLAGNERVLDVGCGDGKITAQIAERVPAGSVVGVDPSKDMIAFAAEHFSAKGHANLRFEVADARRLPFLCEFDLVVTFNALHWVPEQEAAWRAIHVALKPGGRVIGRMVSKGARTSLEQVLEETRQQPRWEKYFDGFKQPYVHLLPEEFRSLVVRGGLDVLRLHVEDKAWDFQTRVGFVAFGEATFIEWTRRIPKPEWHEFINDVLDRYQKVTPEKPSEANTFKFYQMEFDLRSEPEA